MGDFKNELRALQSDIKQVKDEVKLKAHLAKMDLQTEWEKLEPQLDRAASSASVVTQEMVSDLKRRLAEFKQRLGSH